jgi:hypothetical protein
LFFFVEISVIRNDGIIQSRITHEKRLIQKMMLNYPQKYGRPVNDSKDIIHIKQTVQLVQIVQLDAQSQNFITNVWHKYVNNFIHYLKYIITS